MTLDSAKSEVLKGLNNLVVDALVNSIAQLRVENEELAKQLTELKAQKEKK